MKIINYIAYCLCYLMFFLFFWAFGVFATGITLELVGISALINASVPNYSLMDGWLTATGGTLISIGMMKWIDVTNRIKE